FTQDQPFTVAAWFKRRTGEADILSGWGPPRLASQGPILSLRVDAAAVYLGHLSWRSDPVDGQVVSQPSLHGLRPADTAWLYVAVVRTLFHSDTGPLGRKLNTTGAWFELYLDGQRVGQARTVYSGGLETVNRLTLADVRLRYDERSPIPAFALDEL